MSSDTQLLVCIREPPGDPKFRDCSGIISKPQNPGPTKVRVRGRQTPFEIVFVAKNFVYTNPLGEGGLVAIDDISYEGDICPKELPTQLPPVTDPPTTPQTTPAINLNKLACELVSCDFERSGAPCMENLGKGGGFQLGQGQRGNRNTGIRYDASRSTSGSYLWAQGPGQKTFMTPEFELGEDAELRFDVFDGTYDTLFFVCPVDDPS